MKNTARSAIMVAIGAVMLSAAPVGAQSYSSEWLHRQFTTDHRSPQALRDTATQRTPSSTSPTQDVSGHDFSTAWLKRQFAGKQSPSAAFDGVARPAAGEGSSEPLYETWLKRQFSTDHRG